MTKAGTLGEKHPQDILFLPHWEWYKVRQLEVRACIARQECDEAEPKNATPIDCHRDFQSGGREKMRVHAESSE